MADDDVIRIQDEFYILATASLAAEHPLVLKEGDTFGVFDPHADIGRYGSGEQGVYHEDTRYLSRLDLKLGRSRPLFLSSSVRHANDLLLADLTNPDIVLEDGGVLPRGTVHIFRTKLLWNGSCHERLRLSNHGLQAVRLWLTLSFGADFVDIFEVRGTRRERRGALLQPEVEGSRVVLAYRGLDDVLRRTRLDFDPAPRELTGSQARFELRLDPQATTLLEVTVTCEPDGEPRLPVPFDQALAAAERRRSDAQEGRCRIETSNETFNAWLERSRADLDMMTTETVYGPYPYAGVPWFSTVFGRDGLITALETLWLDPSLARGVLANLAALQAGEVEEARDAEPGKILHELRKGEMALRGEVPFGRYYGSIDSTPLFVILAAAAFERTGDRELAQRLWPHLERALAWMDGFGDLDGDGLVEYARRSPNGLTQQGWKDSGDSIFHADGRLAAGPIALCEAQGYVYAARQGAALIAAALGLAERAGTLLAQAESLRTDFEERFWSDDIGTYVLALDGEKRPCHVRASNAGHALWAGIASPERARRAARTLLDDLSFSGWGVRTLSAAELRYNPMSYHNGSVWPHDNALIAAGLVRYGLKAPALRILAALHDASAHFELRRMPELFCGFKRRAGEGPTLYPVACAPQAWSAGAVFLMLQACLGLQVDGAAGRLVLREPALPEFLDVVRIERLAVGGGVVDLVLRREGDDVGVHVARRQGEVSVLVAK
jgi:glycogen debranching enzyme